MKKEDPETKPAATLHKMLQDTVDTGAVTTDNGSHILHCLTIIGQVEGHYTLPGDNKTTKYEHVMPQLVAVE